MTFTEKTFEIGALEGISEKSISEHKKLYSGYIKHANLILQKIKSLSETPESITENTYAIGELQRRFGFEFDGIRNHEYFFEQFAGGAKTIDEASPLATKIKEDFGSIEAWMQAFKLLALTRGIGWAILYFDPISNRLLHAWIDEQHLGHLTGLKVIFAVDMWEHSYLFDYIPAEKKAYIEACLANTNFKVVEERFTA